MALSSKKNLPLALTSSAFGVTSTWQIWSQWQFVFVRDFLISHWDFALELQGVVGVSAEPKDLIEKAATVDTGQMFRNAVFNISGGTAIFGSTNVQVNNQQGDMDGLLKEVAKLGYEKAELEELQQAVIEDQRTSKPTITEGETSKWYLKALKKVGKGAVDVGVDVVSKVIVEALKAYTGS
jgi:hypothetical protein